MDGTGVVVGLRAKGRAKTDTSGFVQDANGDIVFEDIEVREDVAT
jgi:hypothetical protein